MGTGEPSDTTGLPGQHLGEQHLAEQGQGLFHLSLPTDDLAHCIEEVRASGGEVTRDQPRQGLANWRGIELKPKQFFGSQIQLMEYIRFSRITSS